jgi:hypothetical protein
MPCIFTEAPHVARWKVKNAELKKWREPTRGGTDALGPGAERRAAKARTDAPSVGGSAGSAPIAAMTPALSCQP